MSIYMRIEGVKGNVTTKNYSDWIECVDLDFSGITNTINLEIGNDMDRVLHHPAFGEVSVYKHLDSSSIALFEYAHNRIAIPKVEIHSVSSSDPIFTYAKLVLNNVIVSHFSEIAGDTLYSKPRESVAFSYTRIEKTYIPQNPDSSPGSPIVSGYDLAQGQAM